MGMSKEIFFANREQELAEMNRKELAQEAEIYANRLLESREADEILSQSLRIESFLTALNKTLKGKIEQLRTFNGVEFKEGNRTTLNFKEDAKWREINEKLKNREDLLKARARLGKDIFDEDGESVTLISSITSTFITASIK